MEIGHIESSSSVDKQRCLPYHFLDNRVFGLNREPLCVCVAEDKLLVATVGHCIEIRSLDSPERVRSGFSTVDLVKQIVYSKIGKYVATLEVKASRRSLMTHVRVYLNWQTASYSDSPEEVWIGQPMRARIAGCVTPSSQADVEQLEMVELPTLPHTNAANVGCCSATGNLVVASGRIASVFRICVKVHDISRLQFHDFEHLIDVHLSFLIKEVAMCEEFLACASATEVHVICIRYQCTSAERSSVEVTLPNTASFETEDEEFMQQQHRVSNRSQIVVSKTVEVEDKSIDDHGDIEDDVHFIEWDCSLVVGHERSTISRAYENELRASLAKDSWPLTVHLPSLMKSVEVDGCNDSAIQISTPAEYFPGHPIHIEYTGVMDARGAPSRITFDPVSLLFRRFTVPLGTAQRFFLHSLQFLPFPEVTTREVESVSDHPLRSHRRRRRRLGQLRLFFGTASCGFMYDVLNGDVRLTSEFHFASDGEPAQVCQVFLEPSVLHAVGVSSVMTYSLGNWDAIFAQLSHGFPPVALAASDQIRLLGFHTFFNVRHAAYGDSNLVLLTCAPASRVENDSTNDFNWTAYVLQCAPAEYLYNDLMTTSNDGRSEMTEADKAVLLFTEYQACVVLATEMIVGRPPSTSCLANLFVEACCRLAHTHLLLQGDNNRSLAVAFYDLSDAPLEAILQKILGLRRPHGAVKSWNSLQDIVMLIIDNERFSHLGGHLSKETANAILNVFFQSGSSHFLADVLLKNLVRGYDQELAREFMVARMDSDKCQSKDILAACSLLVQADNNADVSEILDRLTADDLVELTSTYPKIWLVHCDDVVRGFSPILQLVQLKHPKAFVLILEKLIFLGHISIDFLHGLLQADWNDVGLAPRTDLIVLSLLENILTNSSLRKWHSPEVTTTLVMLYLRHLEDARSLNQALPTRKKPWSLFGVRHSWLNELPPFRGRSIHDLCEFLDEDGEPSSTKARNAEIDCPCATCNDCLLRLQSLLCDADVASLDVRYRVAAAATTDTLHGSLSVRVLCSPNALVGARLLVSTGGHFRRSSMLLEYGRSMFKHDIDLWQSLLQDLFAAYDRLHAADADEQRTALDNTINGIVSDLAESLAPDQLVAMLPLDGSRFLPQVRRSIAKLQSKRLHDLIVQKGNELKAIV